MASRRRVVVTGMGVVAPNGNDVGAFWDDLVNGRSGIGPIALFDAAEHKVKIAGLPSAASVAARAKEAQAPIAVPKADPNNPGLVANIKPEAAAARALKAAGEEGWKLLIGQMENSPSGSDTTFKKMAAALMDGDKQFNGSQRQKLIGDIMVRRELLTPEQVGGLFKSEGPAFSGEVVNKEVTLGGDFGLLSGVKVETQVDKPMFSLFAQTDTQVSDEVEKGVKIMMQNDDILFSTDGAPDIADLFKPNGEAYKAYVTTNENGERQLQRVPMVVCDHGHDHDGHHHH